MVQQIRLNMDIKVNVDPEQPEELLKRLREWAQYTREVLAPGELSRLPPDIKISPVGPPQDKSIPRILVDGIEELKHQWMPAYGSGEIERERLVKGPTATPDYPLSPGARQLHYAIKSRFPHLRDGEVDRIGNAVLDEVSKRIGLGDSLAFFRLNADGKAEVITYALEHEKREQTR